jgi:hypothetical protein
MSDELPVVDAVFGDVNPHRQAAKKTNTRKRGRRGTYRTTVTSVYLRPDQHRRLNEAADRSGCSLAFILREAFDEWLDRRHHKPRSEA